MTDIENYAELVAEVYRKKRPEATVNVGDEKFPEQYAFVTDPYKFVVAQCTRRAGKSTGLAHRFMRTMLANPGCFCPYLALTRDSARNIMWPVLQEENERFKLGAEFIESKLGMVLPNGSRLQLFGADMKNFIRRLKGIKTPGGAIDECQDFGEHLKSLVDDVLGPSTIDYKGSWLALTGTPGLVPRGYFYDVCMNGLGKAHVYRWGLYENPYLPDPRGFVQDLIDRNKWSHDHPTLRREYMNEWVIDNELRVFLYDAVLNHYESVEGRDDDMRYVLGVDMGHDDADAIACIGWSSKIKKSYLVEESVIKGQDVTALAEDIKRFIDKYHPISIVVDSGGLGKKITAEMNNRFLLPVMPAEKTRKFEYIELLNDAMRRGQFYARNDSQFAQDSVLTKWDRTRSTSSRLVIDESFHSDICDAVLYGFRESLHYISKADPIRPKVGSREWHEAEAREHEEKLSKDVLEEQAFQKEAIDDWL